MALKFDFLTMLAALILFAGGVSAQTGQPDIYYNIRYAHAIMGSITMILIFPIGGIIIRTLSFRGVVWLHVFCQLLGYSMLCYVFSAGIYMSYANDYYIDPHIITGIILFGFATFQVFFGTTHHVQYKKYERRGFFSCLHVMLGRGIITLGILNGGLGLRLSTGFPIGTVANSAELKAYGIVGGIVWVAYNLAISYAEARRIESSSVTENGFMPSKNGVEGRKLGVYERA